MRSLNRPIPPLGSSFVITFSRRTSDKLSLALKEHSSGRVKQNSHAPATALAPIMLFSFTILLYERVLIRILSTLFTHRTFNSFVSILRQSHLLHFTCRICKSFKSIDEDTGTCLRIVVDAALQLQQVVRAFLPAGRKHRLLQRAVSCGERNTENTSVHSVCCHCSTL